MTIINNKNKKTNKRQMQGSRSLGYYSSRTVSSSVLLSYNPLPSGYKNTKRPQKSRQYIHLYIFFINHLSRGFTNLFFTFIYAMLPARFFHLQTTIYTIGQRNTDYRPVHPLFYKSVLGRSHHAHSRYIRMENIPCE